MTNTKLVIAQKVLTQCEKKAKKLHRDALIAKRAERIARSVVRKLKTKKGGCGCSCGCRGK